MLFDLTHNAGELGGLNISLSEARQLEEWEADGLLRRLRQVQRRIAEAKSGKTSLGGVEEEEDAFLQGSEQLLQEE